MRRRLISSARALVGVGVLALLVVRMGVAPFVDAIGALRGPAVVLGLAISALTTIFCVWRWREVARGLGIPVPMRAAVGAYYQSQFLDATVPGGVLGDLHRGVRHGRHVGAVGRGLRAVVWERSLGQVVQLSLTVLLVPLLLVIVASGLPANVAGWDRARGERPVRGRLRAHYELRPVVVRLRNVRNRPVSGVATWTSSGNPHRGSSMPP